MSRYSDTNVTPGMVACRKGCHCPDCQIESLRAQLAAEREKVERLRHGAVTALTMLSACPRVESGIGGMTMDATLSRMFFRRVPNQVAVELEAAFAETANDN